MRARTKWKNRQTGKHNPIDDWLASPERETSFYGPFRKLVDSGANEQVQNTQISQEALWMAPASPPIAIAELRRWLERAETLGHSEAIRLPFGVPSIDQHLPRGGLV